MSEYFVTVSHDGISIDDDDKGAVQFLVAGRKEWIPRSQLDDYDDEEMVIPRWLAEARGVDYEEIGKTPNVCWKR